MSIPTRLDYKTNDGLYQNICLFTISYGRSTYDISYIRNRIHELIESYNNLSNTHPCKTRDTWVPEIKQFRISGESEWNDLYV
jgi:hypothetical protein